jgi:alpha-L-fucosidase
MKKTLIILLFLAASFQGYSQDKDEIAKEWDKMHNTKTDVFKDYNDLKFGMFIHWGAYSSLGGIWQGKEIKGLGEWIMYHAQIPRADYREVCRNFNPVGFNAEEWVKIAKAAGMKYIVAMPKHHDGFALYHSKVTDFNIYDLTPFKRDPIEEIYKACKKHGLRMGIYYSHSIDWMDGGDAGQAQHKLIVPDFINRYATNNFDPAPVTYTDYIENKAKPQMREILTKFPNLVEIWYDYPNQMNRQQSYEFYKLAYEYQPKCLINSRVGNDLGDMLTAGDNQIPKEINSKYKTWETPGTLNNTWGYKSYDNDWKSLNEMLFWIVEIASKGGNYLLNVGPDGNGVIPEESIKILKEIGAWMKINGEAIYGTSRWTTLKEGPTGLEMNSTNSRKEKGFNTVFTSEDFWFTKKKNNVYVISLASPVNNKVSVKSLYNSNQMIKSIKLLGSKGTLKWKASGDRVEITMPAGINPGVPGFVLKVELKSI